MIKKLEKCLVSSLKYLFNNNLKVKEFLDKNPIPSKPYHLPCIKYILLK